MSVPIEKPIIRTFDPHQGTCSKRPDIQTLIANSGPDPVSTAGSSSGSSSGSTGGSAVVLPEWGPWRYGPCYTGKMVIRLSPLV